MDMTPSQKARMAVLNHVLNDLGLGSSDTVNVRVNIVSLTQNGEDWRAVCTSDAHTDRNYAVTYRSNPGQTSVETFTRAQEVRYWDEPPPENPAPTTEYYGAP